MRIALPVMADGNICGHFGHCESFAFFDAEGDKIVSHELVPSPGHQPGVLPVFLADHGANVVIAGGMGAGAVEIFASRGITVILGASGVAEEAVKAYLAGTLKSTGSTCPGHDHKDGHEHSCHK